MNTIVFHPEKDKNAIAEAAAILRRGGLLGIPTETVYGLGADALNETAVLHIFEAKGRPQDNPLILHVPGADWLERYCRDIPPEAYALAERFWPGPLTMILPRRDNVPLRTTGGLDTVGVRCPDHPMTLAIIRESGIPVAAPSGNTSGRPSPTTAQHMLEDMDGKIDGIVDGGPCSVGVESTIIDLTVQPPRLLRPGGKLVYSTCTTNVDENEGQVRFAVEGLGLEPIPLEPFPGFVFAAPELPGCEGTLRVDEGASNAQGFYIALLRKPGDSAAVPGLARGTAATAAYRAIPPAFLAEFGLSPALLPPGDLAVFEDSLHFLPAPALAHLPAAVRWQGMALGKASAQGLIPSARLRALLDPEPQRIPRLDVDDVPVLERLLQGGSLDTGLPGKEASLFWRGLPLGRLRLKAGRAVWSDR